MSTRSVVLSGLFSFKDGIPQTTIEAIYLGIVALFFPWVTCKFQGLLCLANVH